MILYWSDTALDSAGDVRLKAKSVVVNPIQFRAVPDDMVFTHRLGNGRGIDNHVGWTDDILLVISEDSFASFTKLGGQTIYVRELVFSWERALFRWIEHPRVNGGDPLQVKFAEKPVRSHPEDYDFLNETEYKLIGDVFHFNR